MNAFTLQELNVQMNAKNRFLEEYTLLLLLNSKVKQVSAEKL